MKTFRYSRLERRDRRISKSQLTGIHFHVKFSILDVPTFDGILRKHSLNQIRIKLLFRVIELKNEKYFYSSDFISFEIL